MQPRSQDSNHAVRTFALTQIRPPFERALEQHSAAMNSRTISCLLIVFIGGSLFGFGIGYVAPLENLYNRLSNCTATTNKDLCEWISDEGIQGCVWTPRGAHPSDRYPTRHTRTIEPEQDDDDRAMSVCAGREQLLDVHLSRQLPRRCGALLRVGRGAHNLQPPPRILGDGERARGDDDGGRRLRHDVRVRLHHRPPRTQGVARRRVRHQHRRRRAPLRRVGDAVLHVPLRAAPRRALRGRRRARQGSNE